MTKRTFDVRGRRPLGVMIVVFALSAPAVEADPLSLIRWTVDGGGTNPTPSGAFVLGGTVGQHDAGLQMGSPLAVFGGFWAPGVPVPLAVGDQPPGQSDDPASRLPRVARIHAAVPNPAWRRTTFAIELPEEREVEVRVFDLSGALVRTIKRERMPAGEHSLDWDAADSRGHRVRAGVYLVRIRLDEFERSQKVILLH